MQKIVVGPLLVLVAACITVALSASTDPFMCGGTDVCNLRRDQPDQYCTSGRESRCKLCSDENDLCFTERMAFNCTTHCRELDLMKRLEEERGKSCPALGNVTYGYHNSSDNPHPGDRVQVTCDEGYHVEECDVIRCLEYGVWSGDLPECKRNSCPALGNVTFGLHNSSDNPHPGDRVQVTCDEGYHVEECDVIRCLEYGVWSGDLPECKKIMCLPPEIPHGTIAGYEIRTAVGEHIRYNCEEGYDPEDSDSNARCLPNGTWLGATCLRVVRVSSKDPSECTYTVQMLELVGVGGLTVILAIALVITCCMLRHSKRGTCKLKADNLDLVNKDYFRADSDDNNRRPYSDRKGDGDHSCEIDSIDEHQYEPTEDKPLKADPLSPREIDLGLTSKFCSTNDDLSLPIMNDNKSTIPKDCPDQNTPPLTDERSSSNSRHDNPKTKESLSGNSSVFKINNYITVQSNNTSNNNNNINNSSDRKIEHRGNGYLPNKKEVNDSSKRKVKPPSTNYASYPTQATDEDDGATDCDGNCPDGLTCENPDNGAELGHAVRHAQPEDDGVKTAMLALPNNTVLPEDVKRRRKRLCSA